MEKLKAKALAKNEKTNRGRSRNNTGYVRQRADGRWEGQYYFEGERKSCYGSSEEECQGKLNSIYSKIYRGSYVEGSQMSLYDYLHHWHHKYTQIKPSTHSNYDTYIETHIKNSKLGKISLKKLSIDDLCEFFKAKEEFGRMDGKPGGLSPKTLRNIRNMMSEALDYAVNNLRWIDINPCKGVKTPKVVQPTIKVYTSNSQRRIERAALEHENVNALMVLIDLYTGLRIGELCGLNWTDFGEDKEYFDIRRIIERLSVEWADYRSDYQRIYIVNAKPNSKTALYLGTPKTEKGKRRVYTSEQARVGFEKIEAYQKSCGVYRDDGFVFIQRNGNPYEPRAYINLYRDVLKRADVDYRNFHTLRHTFATRAYELAFDIPTLSEILGHAQKSTTENMYGHSLDDTKKKAMAKFNQGFM